MAYHLCYLTQHRSSIERAGLGSSRVAHRLTTFSLQQIWISFTERAGLGSSQVAQLLTNEWWSLLWPTVFARLRCNAITALVPLVRCWVGLGSSWVTRSHFPMGHRPIPKTQPIEHWQFWDHRALRYKKPSSTEANQRIVGPAQILKKEREKKFPFAAVGGWVSGGQAWGHPG